MRYLTNLIKSIINLALDLGFIVLAIVFWFLNFTDHPKWEFIIYCIVVSLLTAGIDNMCINVFSRKYGEHGFNEALSETYMFNKKYNEEKENEEE